MSGGAVRGVVMMAVTPFAQDGAVDVGRLGGLAGDAAEQGFGGFVVAGGAGELRDLATEEVVDLVAAASAQLGPHSRLIAGVFARAGAPAGVDALAEAGAQDLLCFADPGPGTDADRGLARLLAENAAGPRLGVIVDHDGGRFTTAALRQASEEQEGLVVKFGAPDLRAWTGLRAQLPSVATWISGGGDEIAPGFAAHGADGFTSTTANIAPAVIAAFARLIAEGRCRDAAEWGASHLQPLATLRSSRPGYIPAVTKAAMTLLGRGAGEVRRAEARLHSGDLPDLKAAMSALVASAFAT